MRWRRGELVAPDFPPPEEEAGATDAIPAGPLVRAQVRRLGPPPPSRDHGQPSWTLLVVVALLAALVGAGTLAALSRRADTTAPGAAAATPPASATASPGSITATPSSPSPMPSPPVPTAAPTPAPAAGTPASAVSPPSTTPAARAPTVIVAVDPVATPLDLAGKVASDAPGTPLALGRAVRSVLDPATKPRDVYRVVLPAGERFHPVVTASSTRFTVTLGPADAPGAATLCDGLMLSSTCDQPFPIAAGGTYRLTIAAIDDSLRYTLQPGTLPIAAPPGVADLVGQVASNLPGTPLGLGRPVLSVVDGRTKPYDVYTLALRAGQTLRVQVSAVPADEVVRLLPPGAAPFAGAPSPLAGTQLCFAAINLGRCDASAPIAAGGTYTLIVATDTPGVQYTVQATAQ